MQEFLKYFEFFDLLKLWKNQNLQFLYVHQIQSLYFMALNLCK